MKTPSKAQLLLDNANLRRSLDLYQEYLTLAFRDGIRHVNKGATRLSYGGACRAHGGIVLESVRHVDSHHRSVVGVFYFEQFRAEVAAYPLRSDDKDGQDRRTCCEQVAQLIAREQADFYAPKVAVAVAQH